MEKCHLYTQVGDPRDLQMSRAKIADQLREIVKIAGQSREIVEIVEIAEIAEIASDVT